jgi:hypothetical protein
MYSERTRYQAAVLVRFLFHPICASPGNLETVVNGFLGFDHTDGFFGFRAVRNVKTELLTWFTGWYLLRNFKNLDNYYSDAANLAEILAMLSCVPEEIQNCALQNLRDIHYYESGIATFPIKADTLSFLFEQADTSCLS